ncbi:MAG: acyl carrier protein [Alphaproteobacteria bacterium]|nr:acyl carrier protein [Alphaproteobacteria bacterium]
MDGIERRIRSIVEEQFALARDEVTLQSKFYDDLGADSLDILEIVAEAEEAFGIEITNDEGPGIQTVGGLIECVRGHKPEFVDDLAYTNEDAPRRAGKLEAIKQAGARVLHALRIA